MASTIRRTAQPSESLPTVPTAEEWRAMTPTERLRLQVEINAVLISRRQYRMESLETEADQAQAQVDQAQSRADQAQAQADQAIEGLREALLTVLDLRAIPCPDEARARIASAAEPATLRRWLVQARTAVTLEEALSMKPQATS